MASTHLLLFILFPPLSSMPTAGLFPAPQPPRSGPLTPSTDHAALPAASSPPSGSGPRPAHFHHHHSCSLSHSHGSSTSDRGRSRSHSPHGSRLYERYGIAATHGNDTNVVLTWEERSRLQSNQNTHLVSLLPRLSFSVFFYLFGQEGQADSCISSDTGVHAQFIGKETCVER